MTPLIAESEAPLKPTAATPGPSAAAPARFLAALERGPLVLDAAIGTRLIGRGLDLRRDDPCLWNLERPADVLDLHHRDATAGGRVGFTNTFGANRARLAQLGRQRDVEAINRAAVVLARLAAGPRAFVVGDIGPSTADDPGAAGEQAVILIDSGVDALVLETFQLDAAVAALAEVRMAQGWPPVPLIASLWRWPDDVEDAARRLVDAGAAVIGLNCRPGVSRVLPLVRRLAAAVACPLLVKPGVDASDPDCDATPAAFAAAVPALLEHNVRLIGGCCGTTETHVAAIAAACDRVRQPESERPRGAAP